MDNWIKMKNRLRVLLRSTFKKHLASDLNVLDKTERGYYDAIVRRSKSADIEASFSKVQQVQFNDRRKQAYCKVS